MKKKYNFDAKEILALVDTIPAPTKYDIDRAKVAAITCKTAKEFAEFLELDVLAFKAWCNKYPLYLKAVSSWRDHATSEIEVAMAKRAIGFTKTTKRDVLTKLGTVETLHVETYYPADMTAAQFWLKNRAPNDWQDKKEIDVNVNANIRAWLVSAGGQLDPTEVLDIGPGSLIEQQVQEIVDAEFKDNTQEQLEAELISDLITETNNENNLAFNNDTEGQSDFNKSDGTEGVWDFNLVVNNNSPDLSLSPEPENNSSLSPNPPGGAQWSNLNGKWT